MARTSTKAADRAKSQVQIIDRDLYHLREIRRRYSSRMVKMGLASWIIGIVAFTASIYIWVGINIASGLVNIWAPLLIVALAAPIVISAIFIRRLVAKERRLEQMRKNLLDRFEKAMLKKVEKMVTKK